ncbi:hypothetical protein TWF281_002809 [Arthrobotrys megalospora]
MVEDGPYVGKCMFLDEPVLSPFMTKDFTLRLEANYRGVDRNIHEPSLFEKNGIFLTHFSDSDGNYECPLVEIVIHNATEGPTPLVVKRLNLTIGLTVREMVEKIASNIGVMFDRWLGSYRKSQLPPTIKLAFVFNADAGRALGWRLNCSFFKEEEEDKWYIQQSRLKVTTFSS